MVVFAATNAHAAAPCLGAPGPPECLHERRLLRHAEDVSRCGCRGRSDKRLGRGVGREANYFQVYRPRHRGPANRRRSSPLHHHSARDCHWMLHAAFSAVSRASRHAVTQPRLTSVSLSVGDGLTGGSDFMVELQGPSVVRGVVTDQLDGTYDATRSRVPAGTR